MIFLFGVFWGAVGARALRACRRRGIDAHARPARAAARHAQHTPRPHTTARTCVAQVFERHQVLGLAQAVEEAAAKRERAKLAVDRREQRLGARQAQRHVADVVVLHVVADLKVLAHIAWVGGWVGCVGAWVRGCV